MASIAIVNRMRRRSSGILAIFPMDQAKSYLRGGRNLSLDNLEAATGGLDLRLRSLAGAVRLDRELLGQLALAEDLDRLDELGNDAARAQRLHVDGRAGIEDLVERRDVDRERFDAVRVLEAALGNAARHRHLATFEREASTVVTRPRLLTLDALTGGLASARAATATKTLLGLRGSGVRVEIVQRDRHGGTRAAPENLARKKIQS